MLDFAPKHVALDHPLQLLGSADQRPHRGHAVVAKYSFHPLLVPGQHRGPASPPPRAGGFAGDTSRSLDEGGDHA
jgi:hypothetical protein